MTCEGKSLSEKNDHLKHWTLLREKDFFKLYAQKNVFFWRNDIVQNDPMFKKFEQTELSMDLLTIQKPKQNVKISSYKKLTSKSVPRKDAGGKLKAACWSNHFALFGDRHKRNFATGVYQSLYCRLEIQSVVGVSKYCTRQ